MSDYLSRAIQKLKHLQDQTTNVTFGAAQQQVGWFFMNDFQSVIDDLETHKIMLEQTKTPPAATEDVG
ncbi:hypothetical protein [Paenibacillus vini]|uniref:Uncharacterized protein n=1 Tax=Paenibacillus vini TaxID=1476024 RepID=A0ABQ4MJ00_9BACL|nr:hypothetical protein [Paenibacillus vini]GIP55914.1 hypothetical protein J42TS3_49490 [Paenibacillus vini]